MRLQLWFPPVYVHISSVSGCLGGFQRGLRLLAAGVFEYTSFLAVCTLSPALRALLRYVVVLCSHHSL